MLNPVVQEQHDKQYKWWVRGQLLFFGLLIAALPIVHSMITVRG